MTTETPMDLIGMDDAGTLAGLFEERVRRTPQAIAYREFDARARRWQGQTWEAMSHRVGLLRTALKRGGFAPGDRFAIALPNGTDWVAFDSAALSLGLIVVPLYLHDSPANLAHILTDSGARGLVIDTTERWRNLLPHWTELIDLEHVWIRDGLVGDGKDVVRPGTKALADVLEHEGESEPWPKLTPDTVATIIYTSGTTGRPKGVMLSHRALLWNAVMTAGVVPPRSDDRFLSCLPLAHAFERTVGYYLPMLGASQVIYARSIENLSEDLRTQHPTVFLGVPRLFERARLAIEEKAKSNPIRRQLVRAAAAIGWKRVAAARLGGPALSALEQFVWPYLDRWVGTAVRSAFGGHLRIAVSGGAPLPADVACFLIGLGIPLVEGYGLTETGPVVTASPADAFIPGTVGKPLKGIELEVSSLGELEIRSPSLMTGYWQNEAQTAEAVDAHGWLHTGDIAELDKGQLIIRGRVKELIVLSTGEKVAPAAIEAQILGDPLFEQALIVGDGRPFASAILALNEGGWRLRAAELNIPVAQPNHPTASAWILQRLETLLSKLPRHAKIKAVHLTCDQWTVANGLLTPTLKTRRGPLEAKYQDVIEEIYSRKKAPNQG